MSPQTPPPTVIETVKISNFKRVKFATLALHGAPAVSIGGANGAGKSSALDAIQSVLLGKAASPDVPIRTGETSAEVELLLTDGVRLTRRYTESGSTLRIVSADGMSPAKPQAWLDARLAETTVDPVRWLSLKPAEQTAVLRQVSGADTSAIDARRKATYDERTIIGRQRTAARGAAQALPSYPGVTAPPPVSELVAQLRDYDDAVRQRDVAEQRRAAAIGAAEDKITRTRAEYERLRLALDAAKSAMLAAVSERDTLLSTPAPAPAVPDIDRAAVEAQIRDAETLARQAAANAERDRAEKAAAALDAQYDAATAEIDKLDAERAAILGAARMPVDGLTIDPAGAVLLNGVPLSQASQAERIRCAMAIGLATAGSIRVVLIRDGSLLDDASMAIVAEMAATAGAQVIIERVGAEDDGAIVFADGEVVS